MFLSYLSQHRGERLYIRCVGGQQYGLPQTEDEQLQHLFPLSQILRFNEGGGGILLPRFPVADIRAFGYGFGFCLDGGGEFFGDAFTAVGQQVLEIGAQGKRCDI